MKILFALFVALCSTSWAWAAALVQSSSGDARLEVAGVSSPLKASQRIDSGATIHTGADGKVVLRFDDGQMAAISSETTFKVDDYRFEAARPEQGNVAFSLLKGALRLVTGLIGERNQKAFALKTPNATIGIRGTDFMVAIVNPVYISVAQGAIAATNVAGTATIAAGATGMVASATTLVTSIAASALPATVSATFSQLGALPMAGAAGGATGAASGGTTGGATGGAAGGATGGAAGGATGAATGAATAAGSAGASAATAAAVGGISAGTVAIGAAVVGAAAAAAGGNEGTPGTTGTTGTQ